MVFNAIFNIISVISWRSVFRWRKPVYPGKPSDLPQVTDTPDCIGRYNFKYRKITVTAFYNYISDCMQICNMCTLSENI
jgi:hypothetical protein